MIGQPPDVTGITRGFRTGKGKLDPMEHKLPAAAILLGAYLKALRVSAGLSGREAGARITRSQVTIRNIEEGMVRRKADALGLLCHYGVEDRRTFLTVPPASWAADRDLYWCVPVGPGRYLTSANRLHEALAQAVNENHVDVAGGTARPTRPGDDAPPHQGKWWTTYRYLGGAS